VADRVGDRLRIVVTDDGKTAANGAPGTGIGLENVRNRLVSAFGDEGSFGAGALEGGGYQVILLMPVRFAT